MNRISIFRRLVHGIPCMRHGGWIRGALAAARRRARDQRFRLREEQARIRRDGLDDNSRDSGANPCEQCFDSGEIVERQDRGQLRQRRLGYRLGQLEQRLSEIPKDKTIITA